MLYLVDPARLEEVVGDSEPGFRVRQVRSWLYQTPVMTTAAMTNLPTELRDRLAPDLWPFQLEVEQVTDAETTRKWLFRTGDGHAIETVLMGYPQRATLCVSSQAGCALACTFCATGQFGFERHLEPGEIVAQVMFAQAFLRNVGMPGAPDHVTNVVFMGMGEPLANYRRVRESIRRMIEEVGLSARAITVSTVGLVPGIIKLADEPWPVNLAISLHAADDQVRSSMLPINDRHPIAQVVDAAAYFFAAKGRRVSLEWTMIRDVNDTDRQADRLAEIARRLGAHVNLIPMNPTPLTADRPSTPERIERFKNRLREHGVNVTIRDTRGRDIDAACGQLRLKVEGRRQKLSPVEIDG